MTGCFERQIIDEIRPAADVSRLLRENFREYSIERLLRPLTNLDRDVEIVIRETKSQRRGKVRIGAAG